ncbi:type II toxin-antitoxin system HicB family antitoxin [Thauera phenylacetica]|jgi:predicted RNase H-like HicB family nuclease
MTNERQYLVEIRPLSTDEGGGWLATFPDLPDCMRDGETPEAAIEDGYAAAAWLKVAVDCGDAIPEPGVQEANPGDSWLAYPRACTCASSHARDRRVSA